MNHLQLGVQFLPQIAVVLLFCRLVGRFLAFVPRRESEVRAPSNMIAVGDGFRRGPIRSSWF
jgi:hypothetical protein